MAKQKPLSTEPDHHSIAADDAAPIDALRLRALLAEKREACDPALYERVIAYHPFAGESDVAFAAFSADYDRVADEAKAKTQG